MPYSGLPTLDIGPVAVLVVVVALVLGLFIQAPGGVLVARDGAAFRTRLDPGLCGALEGASLLEAPVPSLLHLGAPELVLPTVRRHSTGAPVTSVDSEMTGSEASADFDVDAMITRFRERAKAVRSRGVPPLEGADRRRFVERMQLDYQDFAMLGDAAGSLEDGVLVLRVDLRPGTGAPAE